MEAGICFFRRLRRNVFQFQRPDIKKKIESEGESGAVKKIIDQFMAMDKSRRSVIAALEKRVEELGGSIEKNNACWTTETKGSVGGFVYVHCGLTERIRNTGEKAALRNMLEDGWIELSPQILRACTQEALGSFRKHLSKTEGPNKKYYLEQLDTVLESIEKGCDMTGYFCEEDFLLWPVRSEHYDFVRPLYALRIGQIIDKLPIYSAIGKKDYLAIGWSRLRKKEMLDLKPEWTNAKRWHEAMMALPKLKPSPLGELNPNVSGWQGPLQKR